MGLIQEIPCYIAGSRVYGENSSNEQVVSLDGSVTVSSASTSSSELRQALRYSEECQEKLNRSSLAERVEVVKLILREYAEYRKEVAWGLAHFRGLPSKDSYWMCDLLIDWAAQVDELVSSVWGLGAEGARLIRFKDKIMGKLTYKSKGQGAFITSSTMDGPPGVAAICHAILSGTHMIIRPSWRDVVTHFIFEILHKHKLDHYCQMVRWQSDSQDAMNLNRQLIHNVRQAIVFSSDRTFAELMEGVRGSNLVERIHRYGTGLPLVIVTDQCDIDQAAEMIFVGARRGNGKFCLSHTPVVVDRKVYKPLLERLVKRSQSLKDGDLLDPQTEKGQWEKDDIKTLKNAIPSFGGKIAYGGFQDHSMDLLILENVPKNSPALHQEFPGTLLALIPFDKKDEAVSMAQKSLPINRREAWTVVNIFGSSDEYSEFAARIDSFHFLHQAITSEPRFLLPHQGRYFSFDLTRRQTTVL